VDGTNASAHRDERTVASSGEEQDTKRKGEEMAVISRQQASRPRPLLGFRRQPGRLALFVLRLPLPLYRAGWGWVLGHTFVQVTHAGRKTGQPHATVAMVLAADESTGELVICSAWGPQVDWIQNIRTRPALQVQVGRKSFVPRQRFLTAAEASAVVVGFRRHHPWRLRLLCWALGVEDLRSGAAVRRFVDTRPFVALRPAMSATGVG
jgi:deazaflavin-dependent oxidoreductase (nitroreductase family)